MTPSFVISSVVVPGRAVGVGWAEARYLGYVKWEGPVGSTRPVGEGQGSCGVERPQRQRGERQAWTQGVRPVRKMSTTAPGLQLELEDMQATGGLPTPEMEGMCS